MKNYKISEIAKLSGVTVKALRVYEQKGLLTPTRQPESNYRLYSQDHFDKLLIISCDPNLIISDTKKLAKINVYSNDLKKSEDLNLVWDDSYCGYSDSL